MSRIRTPHDGAKLCDCDACRRKNPSRGNAGSPAVCNQGLCTRKAAKDSQFCRAHARLRPRAYPEGTRVVFVPGPVSRALYSYAPSYGSRGVVVSIPLPGKRATYLKGPAGGLLYVEWQGYVSNGSRVCGVSPFDLMRE